MATLEATSRRESLTTLNLSNGVRQWVRGFGSGPAASVPAGAWTGTDGTSHAVALHNCWTPAAWFFPALSLSAASRDPQASIADLGAATKLGGATEHLQLSRVLTGQAAKITTEIQHLSTADLYLDSTSLLPVALDFNLHPDNNAGRNLPVEVRFSDYRSVAGIRTPFRIQEYLQGSLVLDLTATSIQVNTGLGDLASVDVYDPHATYHQTRTYNYDMLSRLT